MVGLGWEVPGRGFKVAQCLTQYNLSYHDEKNTGFFAYKWDERFLMKRKQFSKQRENEWEGRKLIYQNQHNLDVRQRS